MGWQMKRTAVGFICDCVRVRKKENKVNMRKIGGVVQAKAQLNPIRLMPPPIVTLARGWAIRGLQEVEQKGLAPFSVRTKI